MATSSGKEPLIPDKGGSVDHEQARQTEEDEEQRLTSTLTELVPFLVSTGIEIPKSAVWKMVSFFLFLLTGVVFPTTVTRIYNYDFLVISSVVLGLHIMLSCICFSHISREVWKQGMKSYLLLEKSATSTVIVQADYTDYVSKIKSFRFSWICSFISCLVARGIYEIVRLVFMPNRSLWMILISVLSFIAWTFLSMTILSACNLFGLACKLVTIQLECFEGYLNQKPPTSDIWEKLKSIKSNLLQISSNFSWFLLHTFLVVNVSFMVILLHTLAHKEMIHVIINCDFLLYVIVQVFGLSICLRSAAIVSNKVLDITPILCAWRVKELLRSNDGADDRIRHGADDRIRHALCEYSRFALDGISLSGHTIDSTSVVGIVFFEIGVLQFILGSQSNLLGVMGIFFYRNY